MGLSPFGISPFILEIKIKDFLSSADGAFAKSLLEKETGSLFSLSADGALFFPFVKGETLHFFLCQKEKSGKKEVGNPAG